MKNQQLDVALQAARITEKQLNHVIAYKNDQTLTSIQKAHSLMAMSKHLRKISHDYRQIAQRTREQARALRERETKNRDNDEHSFSVASW